jgi:hypothetical protein
MLLSSPRGCLAVCSVTGQCAKPAPLGRPGARLAGHGDREVNNDLTRHGAAWAAGGCESYSAAAAGRVDMSQTRIKLAPYPTGTLWRLRAETRTFILFNSLPIARREVDEEDWTVIAPNWRVTNADSRKKIRVQYAGNLGLVVTLQGR